MLDKRFEELKLTGNLPSPTGVGLAILQVTQREEASLDEVVGVLQADPTLTGRILKLSNSGEACGYQPATTVREAAMRLGLRTVRNVSLGFSLLAGNRTGRCQAFDYDEFWSHSLAVAVAAQTVAELRRDVTPSEAFTCGLLSGMGRLALASIHPAAYEGVLERARGQSSQILAEIEQESLGTNHRELAAAMLRDWKLPGHYADAVGLVGSGASLEDLPEVAARKLAGTLQDARDLARALSLQIDASAEASARVSADLERMRARLGLAPAALEELWNKVSTGWRAWGDSMRIRAQARLGLVDIHQRAQGAGASAAPAPDLSPASAAERPDAGGAAPTGLRVLLVGLEPELQPELRAVLARDGHAVALAGDGREGLARALEQAPHVVVSAWETAGLDGLELVRSLRKSEVGVRMQFILLCERHKESRLLEAFEDGVDEYVLKPFDPRIVLAHVRSAQRVVRLNERVEALLREREGQLSQLAILNRKMQAVMVTDALTGLLNRRYALDRLQKEVAVACNGSRPLSVIMIDIDHFKAVNDDHGHDVGDAVLRETAGLLRGALRKSDTPCRLGGEEFLVICPGADLCAAGNIAERLRCCARDNVIHFGTFNRSVTISLGVAQLDPAHPEADALIKSADQRVYLAKQGGRDRVVSADPPQAARRAG